MKGKYNSNELKEKLNRCRNIKLDDIILNDVDEISSIKIDKRKSSNERIFDFIVKIKKSYIFKCNGKLVKINFSNTNFTADDCLTQYLKNQYK